MIKNELIIKYTPSEDDIANVKEIRDFLEEMEIPYKESEEVYGMFTIEDIKGQMIELRYVSSAHYPMDNSKRFGPEYKGVPNNYFINISQKNYEENNIRTIWIYDFEMRQKSDLVTINGEVIKDYRRQWNVICNTIKNCCNKIENIIYARDCEVVELTTRESKFFLEANCFYSFRPATVTLGLKLKKDKGASKKGELVFLYSFGMCYYGNKNRQEDPKIEIIRVATKLNHRCQGGSSKCLLHFLKNYPTITVNGKDGKKEVKVNDLVFFVDSSHLDSRSMRSLNFRFSQWRGEGFMNVLLEDIDEIYERPDGKKIHLFGKKGDIQMRKPAAHKRIMQLIQERKLVSIANAGTSVFEVNRLEYLKQIEENKKKK